jgi:hypothetical protein
MSCLDYAWELFMPFVESQLAVLRSWANRTLPPRYRRQTAAWSWEPATRMTALLEDFGQSRTGVFQELLSQSNDRLAPLSDPLTCDLGLHAWLRPQREESYSMWLQWSLQQLADWESIGQVLGLLPTRATGATIEVDREVPISYRDDAGHGRLDLLIRQGSETLCVLEIKTKSFFDEDLRKQLSYSESPNVSPGAERIFIAVDTEGFDLRGFRFLSWSEICIRLRRLTPHVAANKNQLTAALLLAFVGAVEQNLLGLAQSEKDLGALPRTVDHLKRFLKQTR